MEKRVENIDIRRGKRCRGSRYMIKYKGKRAGLSLGSLEKSETRFMPGLAWRLSLIMEVEMSKERDERREKVMKVLRTVDLTGVNFDSEDFPVKNTATIFFTNGLKMRCGVEIYEQPGIEEAIRAIALAFLPSYHYEYQRYDPAEIDKEWKLKVEIYANGKFYTSEAHGGRKFYDLGSPAIVFRYENQGCDSYERYEIKNVMSLGRVKM